MSHNPNAHPIALVASFVKPGRVGGAEFMARNLLSGMESERAHFHVLAPENWYVPLEGTATKNYAVNVRGSRFLSEAKFACAPPTAFSGTVFLNYFTPPVLSKKLGRTVTVIHDLMYLHFPLFVTAQKRAWLYLTHQLTLRRADQIVVISEFVKRDLLERYGSRWESKVTVIPNPISWSRFERACPLTHFALNGRRVILSVAAAWPHKNIANLIQAFRLLRSRPEFRDTLLILVGQGYAELTGGTRPSSLGAIDTKGDEGIYFTGHISDEQLSWCYANCTAFVLPSLFEGFGMPAVEALGLRIPTVVTRLTALPEVTMGLAKFIDDATDPESIAAALNEILENPEAHRPSEAEAARLRDHYSPSRIARSYIEAVRD